MNAPESQPQVRDVLTVERPEQLKALGHPLRLKVLQALGESDQALTNRELAARLSVDPGHLHFHVRMLHRAGLIVLVEGGRGREKPYRPAAMHVQVAPEFRSSPLTGELNAMMLDEIGRGWAAYGTTSRFRVGQLTVRLDPDRVRELFTEFLERATELEDADEEPIIVTMVVHPKTAAPDSD
jgi:DNA-binding transcriptional ArsR family regulator